MLDRGVQVRRADQRELSFLLARNARKVGEGGGDGHEQIEVVTAPLDGIDEWLQSRACAGVAIDSKIYMGLYFLNEVTSSGIPLGATAGLSSSAETAPAQHCWTSQQWHPTSTRTRSLELRPCCAARRSPADSLAEPLAQPLQRRACNRAGRDGPG